MSEIDERSSVSVGDALKASQLLSRTNPMYTRIVDEVSRRVSDLSQKESVRRTKAFPVLRTVNLSLVESDLLSRHYPEFTVYNYSNSSPGHAYYVAARQMANEYLTYQAAGLTDTLIHLGGSTLSYIMREGLNVHLETDLTNSVAAHSRLTESINISRIMGDYATVISDTGALCCRRNYEAYLTRADYVMCTSSSTCRCKADALCVDLSMFSMSPLQFASAMRQANSIVGYGFIPYHASILFADKGEIPDCGIRYVKTDTTVDFIYPFGVEGIRSIPLSIYTAWLTNHEVVVGYGDSAKVYHCQLGKPRGPFLFFQMTLVDVQPGKSVFKHALDLPQNSESYVVTAYLLKDLISDPSKFDSWSKQVFLFDKKTLDKLYEFSMQLTPENFNRYAIRKQLKIMDRVTLEGTTVTHGVVPQQDSAIVGIVHARAFVDRYESGQLTKQMMEHLKAVAGFGSSSRLVKLRAVTAWAMYYVWDSTVGIAVDSISSLCTWLRKVFTSSPDQPKFALAPSYVLYSSLVSAWKNRVSFKRPLATRLLSSYYTPSGYSLRGDTLAYAIHNATMKATTSSQLRAAVSIIGTVHSEVTHVYEDTTTTSLTEEVSSDISLEIADALVSDLRMLNEFDEPSVERHVMPTTRVKLVDTQVTDMKPDFEFDPDYVDTLNTVYEQFNPGVADLPIYADVGSISYDNQDRHLMADYLRIPRIFDTVPKDRYYYMSRLRAIGAPKRQETQHELLSSLAARNLSAPRIALPQDTDVIIPDIWDKFLSTMCSSDARTKLERYQSDPVALEETAYRDWISKAKPDTVKSVKREIEEDSCAMGEMPVDEYLMMLKSDVKPPLGNKPMFERIEPQVIVYHKKAVSSLYSSIFRVLIRRFLSLLKPNVHLNLLKDNKHISSLIASVHPFGQKCIYLENDFSKYDKSQEEFVFKLEAYILQMLGMNRDMLARWVEGHVECTMRSITTGISLSIRYQRKSGDSFTSGGNGFLNIMSVSYAYSVSDFKWAVFMGDDSELALTTAGYSSDAVQILAEVFNLSAKMYVTDSPYFSSTFIVIDDDNRHVSMIPDPIKWIEKRSQPVSADEPSWNERFISAADSCSAYKHRINTSQLSRMVTERYSIAKRYADALPSAIATAISDYDKFRACYESEPTLLSY